MLVFDRDELLLEGVQEAVRREGIESAVITGGIGSLTNLNYHVITSTGLPPVDNTIEVTGAIELASVQGTVVGGDPHIHIIASNYDTTETYIGHLDAGSRVCYRAEVSLTVLDGVRLERYGDGSGMIWIRETGSK